MTFVTEERFLSRFWWYRASLISRRQTTEVHFVNGSARVLMMMKRTPRMNEFRFCCTDRVRAFEREFAREIAVVRDSLNALLVSSVRKRSALSRLSASLLCVSSASVFLMHFQGFSPLHRKVISQRREEVLKRQRPFSRFGVKCRGCFRPNTAGTESTSTRRRGRCFISTSS